MAPPGASRVSLAWLRQPLWLGVGLLLLVWGLLGWGYFSGLAAVHRTAHVQVLNTAVLLGNGLTHVLDDVDTQLQQVQAQAAEAFAHGQPSASQSQALKRVLQRISEHQPLPVLAGVMDLQARAHWLPDGMGNGATVLSPDTVNALLELPGELISLGPTLSVFTQAWVVRFVRVVTDAQGHPVALAFADVSTEVLGRGFNEVDLGQEGIVNLRTTDLAQVYRQPMAKGISAAVGNRNVSQTARDLLAMPGKAEQGFTYTTVAPIDGTERVYAYYKVPRFPFYMTVGRATADLSAQFRTTSALVITATALASVGLLLMGWRLRRKAIGLAQGYTNLSQEAERSAAALAASMKVTQSRNELLSQVLRGEALGQLLLGAMNSLDIHHKLGHDVGVGLWHWEAQRRRWACRLSNMPELLQEALAESDMMVLSGKDWLLHPDDPLWPNMALAMVQPQPTWQTACSWPGEHETERYTWVVFSSQAEVDLPELREQLGELFTVFQMAIHTHLQGKLVKEQREDMFALYDNSPAGYLTVNLQGDVLRANRTLLGWLGYLPSELVNRKPLHQLLLGPSDADTSAKRPGQGMSVVDLLDKWGNPVPIQGEMAWLCRDGRQLHTVTASSVVRNDSGEPIGLHIAVSDVTQLRRQRHVFSNVLMHAPMAVHVANAITQNVMFMNTAFNEMAKKVKGSAVHPNLDRWFVDEAAYAGVCRVVQAGAPVLHRLMAIRSQQTPEGETLWAMCSFMPLEFNGRAAVLTWMFDVTAMHLAQTQADQANTAKSRFIADLSHELRTPLNAIAGMVHALSEASLPAPPKRMVQVLSQATRDLMGLLDDVLDLSKADAGELVIHPAPFALGPWLQGVLALFDEQAQSKGLTLQADLAPDVPPWVKGDAGKLRQMLANLLSNAIKFTDHGGVTVALNAASDRPHDITLRVAVRDTGPGVAKADQASLFQPYHQGSASLGTLKGTGLGLSIVRRYAEAMGGSVGLSSQQGEGTTVWFEVPLPVVWEAPDPVVNEQPAKPLPQPGARRMGLRGLRVLAVDDSPSNLDVVEVLLTPQGVDLTRCTSGDEALRALKAQPRGFDVVLMDLQMPHMDGYATTLALRQVAPTLPVLAFTAGSGDDLASRVREVGMLGLITKPVVPAKLIQALQPFVRSPLELSLRPNRPSLELTLETSSEHQASAAPTPDAPAMAPADWPIVPGIDEVEVSERLLGNVAMYRELLLRNTQEIKDFLAQWAQVAQLDALAAAQPALHRIKGQTGNLSIQALFRSVSEAERVLAKRQTLSQAQWQTLLGALRTWVAQVEGLAWLYPDRPLEPSDTLSAETALALLRPVWQAVVARQFGAVGEASAIDALMRLSAWAAAWGEVTDALNRYDYAGAEAALSSLGNHLQAPPPEGVSGNP